MPKADDVEKEVTAERRSNGFFFLFLFALVACIDGAKTFLGSESLSEFEKVLGFAVVFCFVGWHIDNFLCELRLRLNKITLRLAAIEEKLGAKQG